MKTVSAFAILASYASCFVDYCIYKTMTIKWKVNSYLHTTSQITEVVKLEEKHLMIFTIFPIQVVHMLTCLLSTSMSAT